MTDAQKQYYLRQQMKAIQDELGEGEGNEIKELRDAHRAGEPARRTCSMVAEREVDRLARMGPASPEYQMIRTYLDWILELPWDDGHRGSPRPDRSAARARRGSLRSRQGQGAHRRVPRRAQAEGRHEGADPVLRRPARRRQDVARPVDRARDAAQVRAHLARRRPRRSRDSRPSPHLHRRRCPAASCRRCKQAGSANPVFMLDELDKVAVGYQGDPAAALLEVLDPAQNNTFRDHYLEVPFDLSKVLFIATANQIGPVHPALRDRMEIVCAVGLHRRREGATSRARYLIPRQLDRARAAAGRGDDHRRGAARWSSASTRAKPACAISSGRSAPSRARSRRGSRPAPRPVDTVVERRRARKLSRPGALQAARSRSARRGRASPPASRGPKPAATCCSSKRACCPAAAARSS